jgi:Aldehyde dehydrogenase family
MLVHASVYDRVAERGATLADGMRCGDPFDLATVVGPVITKSAQERILGTIDRAQSESAGRLLVGGGTPGGDLANGFYVEPSSTVSVPSGTEAWGCLRRFRCWPLEGGNTGFPVAGRSRRGRAPHKAFAGSTAPGVVRSSSGFGTP